MEGASSSALAAGGEYARVRLRLTGKLTPLRRRSSAPSDGGSASSSSTDIEEEEAELRGLLDAAVARAEQENSWLRSHDAWARVGGLLPLLTEAQGLLLTSERSRCLEQQQRRGRASRVRFVCYDLSAVEQPGSSNKGASSNQDTLLDVLAQLVGRQKALVESCTPTQRAPALSALVAALRAESASQQTARTKRAAGWCADAFEALLSDGTLLYESRLSELLGSLLRYHLHVIFDRPSRNALRAAERGEAAREILANDAARDSRGRAALRFYVPRADAGVTQSGSGGNGGGGGGGSSSSSSSPPTFWGDGRSSPEGSSGNNHGGGPGSGPGSGNHGSGSGPPATAAPTAQQQTPSSSSSSTSPPPDGNKAGLTADLRKELSTLELVEMPLNGKRDENRGPPPCCLVLHASLSLYLSLCRAHTSHPHPDTLLSQARWALSASATTARSALSSPTR